MKTTKPLKTAAVLSLAAGLALGAAGCSQEKHSSGSSHRTSSASASASSSASSTPSSSYTPWTPHPSTSSTSASPSASTSATGRSADRAGAASCSGGDPGLDSRLHDGICATNPSDYWSESETYRTPVNTVGQNFISSPTGNIACQMDTNGTACFRKEPTAEVVGVFGNGAGREAPEITDMEASYSRTLEYGEVAVGGDVACSSAYVGMTCWNTQTGHGVFVSKHDVRTW